MHGLGDVLIFPGHEGHVGASWKNKIEQGRQNCKEDGAKFHNNAWHPIGIQFFGLSDGFRGYMKK